MFVALGGGPIVFGQIDTPLLLLNVQVDELHFIGLLCQIGFDHRQDNRTVFWLLAMLLSESRSGVSVSD